MATNKEKEIMATDNEKTVKIITDRFKSSETYKKQYQDIWNNSVRQYEGILENFEELKAAHRSRLYIPYSFILIEWVIESIIQEYEQTNPIVKFNPVGDTPLEVALRNEGLFDYQLHLNDILDNMEMAVRQQISFGKGIIGTNWDINKSSPLGLILEWIDLFNWFPDTKADSLKECEWVIIRKERSIEYIKEKLDSGFFTNKQGGKALIDNLKNIKITPYNKEGEINKGIKILPSGEAVIELLEMWDKFDNKWYVCAGQKYILKKEENPFAHKKLPFAELRNCKRPQGLMYDRGYFELLKDLQDELNAKRNIRNDNENETVKRVLKVRKGSNITPKALKYMLSNKTLEVSTMDDIQPLQWNALPQEHYRAEAEIKSEMQALVGASDYNLGNVPSRQELATTMMSLQKAGRGRMVFSLRNVGLALCEIANQVAVNNAEFIKQDIIKAILGNPIIEPAKDLEGNPITEQIPAEGGMVAPNGQPLMKAVQKMIERQPTGTDLVGKFDFKTQLQSASITKEERQQKALLLYTRLQADPYVNPKKRITGLLTAFGESNPEEWFTPQPQVTGSGGTSQGGEGIPPQLSEMFANIRNASGSGAR
jgi:hypothetical protein